MRTLARWHIWLGWLVAVPFILWTVSGLWMVARPIEEVRGGALRKEASALPTGLTPVLPKFMPTRTERLELVMRADHPVWVIQTKEGAVRVADAATGLAMPDINAALARRISDHALVSPGKVVAVQRYAGDANPLELRRGRPAWGVRYADGVHLYVDAESGAVLAVRTPQWRLFDLMWGLHIMDPAGREDTSHPLLIGFAILSVLGALFGTVLLFRRRRAPLRPR